MCTISSFTPITVTERGCHSQRPQNSFRTNRDSFKTPRSMKYMLSKVQPSDRPPVVSLSQFTEFSKVPIKWCICLYYMQCACTFCTRVTSICMSLQECAMGLEARRWTLRRFCSQTLFELLQNNGICFQALVDAFRHQTRQPMLQ